MQHTIDQAMDKIALLESVAEAWNSKGIEYAVCHGIEGYPEAVGRDLDVIVRGRQLRQAQRLAAERLRAEGFAVLMPPNHWGGKWLFAIRDTIRLEIDLIPFLFRGPALIVAAPEPTLRVGPFRVDPWASFAKRILMPILGRRLPKQPLLVAGEEEFARSRCRSLFGRRLTGALFACLHDQDARGLPELACRMRTSSVTRALFLHPLRSLRLFFPWLRKSLFPRFSRCAPIIALVGPDGVGKTATLQVLLRSSPDPFCGFVARHWRPGLLPRPGSLLGHPAPLPRADGLLPPRREPGRLHWLRLAYYYVDFTLGHFLRDRFDSSQLRIVLYDRHALDMAVDPVRYGLSSSSGTRMLWRLIPRPDLVVLLYDEPQRIRSRKRELEVAEIERQLREWLRLAHEGQVGAIIRVDGGPDQAALAVNELIFEAFMETNRRHAWAPHRKNATELLASALSATAEPNKTARRDPIVAFGRIGSKDGREYLLPLSRRKATLNALRLYRPQKTVPRLLHKVLSTAIAWGVGRFLLPKVYLPVWRGESARPAGRWLLEYLQSVLKCDSITAGASLGLPGPQRKPVLLLMSAAGQPIGYAKIAWNEQTRLLLENEKRTLDFFSSHSFVHGLVPRAIHYGDWQGMTVLVTEPVDMGRNERSALQLQELHVEFLLELARKCPLVESFANSRFFSVMMSRIDSLRGRTPRYKLRLFEDAMDLLTSKLDCGELPWVWRTGDFVPWNVGVDRKKGKIVAVDLEYAAPGSVAGWDLFHFLSRSGIAFQDELLPARLAESEVALSYFRALRVDHELIPALQAAYLLDLWTMREQSWDLSPAQMPGEAAALLRGMSNHLFVIMERLKSGGAVAG